MRLSYRVSTAAMLLAACKPAASPPPDTSAVARSTWSAQSLLLLTGDYYWTFSTAEDGLAGRVRLEDLFSNGSATER